MTAEERGVGEREPLFAVTEEQLAQARIIVGHVIREPFTKRAWAELGYFLVSGALAVVGLAFVGATMVVGAILAITVVGLAVLALSVRSARGIGGWHRGLVRSMLGESVPDPALFEHRRGFFGWLGAALRDRVGWRSVGYLLIKVPWTALGVYVAFSLWWDAFACLLHPVFSGHNGPATFGLVHDLFSPGFLATDNTSFAHGVGLFVIGIALLLAAPWVMRGFTNVDRLLVRTLLGPDPVTSRVRSLEQARAHTVDASAATLRRIERDLHDGTQAQLVALAMRLGMAKEKLEAPGEVDVERVRQLVDEAHRGAKEAIAELRDIAAESTHLPSTSGSKGRWRR